MSGLTVHRSEGLGKLNHGFQPDKLNMTSSTMSSSQSIEQESRMSSSVDFEPETKPDLISSSNFGRSWTHSKDNHPPRKDTSKPGKTKQGKLSRIMIVLIAVIILLLLLTVAVVVSVYFTVLKDRSEGRQPTHVPTTHTPETHTPQTHTPQTTTNNTRIVAPRMRQNSTVTSPPLEATTGQKEDVSLCGVVRTGSTGRIVGGTAAARGVYPWVVSVYIDGAIQCAGSIIDTEHVITAAHCLEDVRLTEAMSRIRIVAGTHLVNNNSTLNNIQNISVQAFYRHANFNQDTPTTYDSYLNDIAVLRLSRHLAFDTFVSSVCLPDASSRLPSRCTVVGWGATSTDPETYPDELREVTLQTYNSSECKENFSRHFRLLYDDISYYLSDGVMCAANGSSGGLDACTGDSGGPLFCREEDPVTHRERYTQYGVVSWGEGCAEAGSPGFYAYLPYFATWLKEVAKPALTGR